MKKKKKTNILSPSFGLKLVFRHVTGSSAKSTTSQTTCIEANFSFCAGGNDR